MKLHVGCGERYLPGYVHVDARPAPHVDLVCDIFTMNRCFVPGNVDEIYHCALLEHLPRDRVPEILAGFHRLLRPGGRLVSSVPNFAAIAICHARGHPLENLFGMLYGRGDYPENVHHGTFDRPYYTRLLQDAGFKNVRDYDWRTFLPAGYDDFSRAYLPHLDFDHGVQMMLNVMADR